MSWCGIISYQAALAQVKYVADRVGSYWTANQPPVGLVQPVQGGWKQGSPPCRLVALGKGAARSGRLLDAPQDVPVAG